MGQSGLLTLQQIRFMGPRIVPSSQLFPPAPNPPQRQQRSWNRIPSTTMCADLLSTSTLSSQHAYALERRSKPRSRPRLGMLVIYTLAAFLATVVVCVATLPIIHTISFRTPALIGPSLLLSSSTPSSFLIQQSHQSPPPHPPTPWSAVAVPLSTEQQPSTFVKKREQQQTKVATLVSTSHTETKETTDFEISLHPPENLPHQCYLQHSGIEDADTETWEYAFNARSFCMTSTICIQPLSKVQTATFYSVAALSETKCVNSTASFIPNPNQDKLNCTEVQNLVHMAHGHFDGPRKPVYPKYEPFGSLTNDELKSARWMNGVVFFVPSFPHMGNIFHFSFVAGSVGYIVSAIPNLVEKWRGLQHTNKKLPSPLPVTIMLRGGSLSSFGGWQVGVLSFIINFRLQKAGLSVSLATMNESVIGGIGNSLVSKELTCAKSAVLLGSRSHINLWPFPTTKWIAPHGGSVPIESISFRRSMYDATGIPTLLPLLPAGVFTPPPPTSLFDLPPRVIGYSRRNVFPDHPKDSFQQGTIRRFSDSDEQWFISMLKDVAAAHNFTYVTLQTGSEIPFEDQVRLYSKVGYVAGIHGANLMNSVFMKPFGGLMELFAGGALQCYTAGANSGLEYVGYNPVKRASGKESGCKPSHPICWHLEHSRRVMINTDEDHRLLRNHVEDSVRRIEMFYEKFERFGGIPVYYDPELSVYSIAWGRAET